jgi:hypothetical protein
MSGLGQFVRAATIVAIPAAAAGALIAAAQRERLLEAVRLEGTKRLTDDDAC